MTRTFDPDRPLPVEVVDELLELSRRAPSAGFSQGVVFVALSGDDAAMFWDVTGAGAWFADHSPGVVDASVIVLPLADQDAYTARYSEADKAGHGLDDADNWPVPFWMIDAAMATQQLLLLAEDRGIGALFFGLSHGERVLLDRLGAPAGVRAIGVVTLGYRAASDRPSGSPTSRSRRPASEVIAWGHWPTQA